MSITVDSAGVAKTAEDIFQKRRLAWAEDLESGRRSQIDGKLGTVLEDGVTPKGYCCLGVGAELAVDDGMNIDRTIENDLILFDGEDADFPEGLAEWLGVDVHLELELTDEVAEKLNEGREDEWDTEFTGGDVMTPIEMNDTYRLTFPEIGACVRQTFGLPPAS